MTYLLKLADLLPEVVLLPGLLLLSSLQSQPQIGHLKQQADQEDQRYIHVCTLDYLYIVKNNAFVWSFSTKKSMVCCQSAYTVFSDDITVTHDNK